MADKKSAQGVDQEPPASEDQAEFVVEEDPQAGQDARVLVPEDVVSDIIRKRVYGAVALGLAPIPLLDLVGLFAIQVELVRRLSKEYQIPFKANLTKSLIVSLVGGGLPVVAAPLMASLMKFVPVIGQTTGAVSMSILGGAATYGVGQVFARHFASGGSLVDFKTEKMREYFNQKFKEGKDVAADVDQGAKSQA